MQFNEKVPLGRTGLLVSRIGIGCSYGIGTRALEEAFDRGINYFYFGTLRRRAMADAVHHLTPSRRDEIVVAIQSYARWPRVFEKSADMALKKLRLDYADVIILGKKDEDPSTALVEQAVAMRTSGKSGFSRFQRTGANSFKNI